MESKIIRFSNSTFESNISKFPVSLDVDFSGFFGNNTVFNANIYKISAILSSVIYAYIALDGQSAESVLERLGMSKIKRYKLSGLESNNHISHMVIGYRDVTHGVRSKRIFSITIRGTQTTVGEWLSNFDIGANHEFWGDVDNHKGFDIAASSFESRIEEYINTNASNSADTVLWFCGHSRGAAISDILAAKFSGKYEVLAYNFAAPSTTTSSKKGSFGNIFNIINSEDLAPMIPFKEWGYGRYGKSCFFSFSSEKNAVNLFEAYTNKKYPCDNTESKVKKISEILLKMFPEKELFASERTAGLFKEVAASALAGKDIAPVLIKAACDGRIRISPLDIAILIPEIPNLMAKDLKESIEFAHRQDTYVIAAL
ncbi:hypothetical protein FACS1894216_01890 [Synergistales bacterium]|nr:hypothetical protein FACS1894216_01890 [Synergistales bacterium]